MALSDPEAGIKVVESVQEDMVVVQVSDFLEEKPLDGEALDEETTSFKDFVCLSRKALLATAVAAVVLCALSLLAFFYTPMYLGGAGSPESEEVSEEIVVHMSGHDVDNADVHTVFEHMQAGEKNMTLQLFDVDSNMSSNLSVLVERFEHGPAIPSKLILLINEDIGGFSIGNISVKALICDSNGTMETWCVLETTHPRLLLDDNEADVIKHGITWAVVGSVLITAIVAGGEAVWAAAPAIAGAAVTAGCFPAHATVQALAGTRAVKSLTIGTMLLTSQGFAPMLLSGHHDPESTTTMIKLTTASNHTVTMTPDHYLPLPGGAYKSAGRVEVGDELLVQSGAEFAPSTVKAVDLVQEQGLFNPFTTTGDLVVDGVLASCHSAWFLEGHLSEDYIVPSYQRVFAPLVLLYRAAPGWFARFSAEFAGDRRALSEAGLFDIAKAAAITLFQK